MPKRKNDRRRTVNESLVLQAPPALALTLAHTPPPTLTPTTLLVRPTHVGICGSDVEYLKHGQIGPFVVREPMICGHEAAGTVVHVGEDLTGWAVGDRVALEPGIPCRQCSSCKAGRYNLCPDMRFFATPPVHGAIQPRIAHPADFAHKLPANVSNAEGALVEPLAVGVHACRRGRVGPGSRVAVLGAGPIGLVCTAVAKAFGASVVVTTDVVSSRLVTAAEMGADHTLNVGIYGRDDTSPARIAEALRALEPSTADGFDAVFECCGITQVTNSALAAARNGGTVVCIGMRDATMQLDMLAANCREVDVRGIFRYVNCYPTAIDLIASGRVNVLPLITHRFALEDYEEAFETASTGKGIKVMFELDYD